MSLTSSEISVETWKNAPTSSAIQKPQQFLVSLCSFTYLQDVNRTHDLTLPYSAAGLIPNYNPNDPAHNANSPPACYLTVNFVTASSTPTSTPVSGQILFSECHISGADKHSAEFHDSIILNHLIDFNAICPLEFGKCRGDWLTSFHNALFQILTAVSRPSISGYPHPTSTSLWSTRDPRLKWSQLELGRDLLIKLCARSFASRWVFLVHRTIHLKSSLSNALEES